MQNNDWDEFERSFWLLWLCVGIVVGMAAALVVPVMGSIIKNMWP